MPKPDDRDARRRKLHNAVRPPAPGWQTQVVPLPASHNWKCSPGHLLLVADRGEVSFEYPDGWHVSPGDKGEIRIHDRPHPADECRIQLSIIRTPGYGAAAFKDLPLTELLRNALADEADRAGCPGWTRVSDVTTLERPGLRLVWAESSWLDREQGDRKVMCRQLIARAPMTHPFITFDYYEDRGDAFRPVWLHMVQTLRIASPRSLFGDALN